MRTFIDGCGNCLPLLIINPQLSKSAMGLYRMLITYLRSYSVPVFKSFFKAYKDTTGGARSSNSGETGTLPLMQAVASIPWTTS